MAAAPAPFASASLYVGDLASDVTEALLFEIFNAVGPVASIRVCRDAATRRSLGYAYVNFHRVDDAERALDTLNFKNIKNRPCRIMWCNRDPSLRKSGLGNVFVNGLAKTIDNKQLYDTFSVFGNILSCKVATNDKSESLGYGFVHFEEAESASAAIEKVNGKQICDQIVHVAPFKGRKERGVSKNVFTNVFVKNFGADVTKEQLDELFSKHGTVTSSVINMNQQKQRGFGFYNFASAEEARAAVDALNNFEVNGVKLYVGRAQKKEERLRELRDQFESLKAEKQKKYAGVNLFVKNLPDDVDDQQLSQEFSKFGSITSAKVMKDSTGNSKGFGFICFSTSDEATRAVTEMNNKMFFGKPLYVALHQRKEHRRAMLEQQFNARMKMGGAMQPIPAQYGAQVGPVGPMMMPKFPQNPQAMMYPPQAAVATNPMMAARRWQPVPQMMRPAINFHLMPVNTRPGAGPQQMANVGMMQQQQPQQRGPRQNRPQRQNMNQQGQPGIKYADNVRNRQPQGDAAAPVATAEVAAVESVEAQANDESSIIKALAAAPEDMKKQIIGERLFPLIHAQQPGLAGKITGMLLEMDNGELIHLLEHRPSLNEKIQEAVSVLQAHGFDAETGEPTETSEEQQ